jgi:hypothetical protein
MPVRPVIQFTHPPSSPPIPDFEELASLYHVPGENAAIRFFDPDSVSDLQSMQAILKGRESKKWMDDAAPLTISDYQDWAGTHTHEHFLFAVLDARNPTPSVLINVHGFVYLYSEKTEKFRVKRMVKRNLLPEGTDPYRCLEISFAAKPRDSGVQAGSGLIGSAVRQSCQQVSLLLDGQADPQNPLYLFAFVDLNNGPAQRTLESAGFEARGHMRYDWDSQEDSVFYLLNWQKLQEKIRQKLVESQAH